MSEPNILYATIAGWGEVSSEDSNITSVIAADNGAGTATFLLPYSSAATTITTSEIGAQVWVQDVTGLVDGYYTLVLVFTFGAFAFAYIKGDPANFSLSTGVVTGTIRIEDHFKLCSAVPSWVTGADAAARWHTGLTNLTPSLSSEVKIRGGIAKSDGITISHNAVYTGLDKVRWKILNEDSTIETDKKVWGPNDVSSIVVKYGIPYMDSFENPDTAPSLGVYEPTFWGSECIRVDSASSLGSDQYSLGMTRGLLNTEAYWHSYGELFVDGFTTPAGKACEIRYLSDSSTQYFDSNFVFDGVITSLSYNNSGLVQNLEISDDLLKSKQRESSGQLVATCQWTLDSTQDERVSIIQQSKEHSWKWIKANDICIRLSQSETSSLNVIESTKDTVPEEAYGYVVSTQQVLSQLRIGRNTINGVLVKKQSSDDKWMELNRPLLYNTDLAGLGADSDDRQEFLDREDLIYYLEGNDFHGTPNGEPYVSTAKIQSKGYKIEPAHVFEANEYGPIQIYLSTAVTNRMIGVNPVEVILQILLTRYGDSTNTFNYASRDWDFDILPPELGLGIPASKIDADSFINIGQFFDDNRLYVRNAFITASDSPKLDSWLEDNILKPFLLSICVDTTGKIRLTRLNDSSFKTTMTTLENDDLAFQSGGDSPEAVSLSYDASNLIQNITAKFERPWLRPSNPQSNKIFNFKYANDGIAAQYRSLGNSSLEMKPDFSFMETDSEYSKWGNYYGRYLGNYRHIIPTIKCYVLNEFEGLTGEYVFVDMDHIPDARGTTTENLKGVGLITKRRTDTIQGVDELTVAVVETINITPTRAFAASGKMDSVSSSTVFDLEEVQYTPGDLSPYASDSASFQEGDFVLLYDENFVLKSFNGSGDPGPKEISTISGDTVTLVSAWTDNSLSNITPVIGDIMMLSEEDSQTTASQTNYMYIYTNRSDQYRFE